MKPAFPKVESRIQQLAKRLSPLIVQTVRQYIAIDQRRRAKVLLKHLLAMKKKNEPISMVTAYDYNQGKLADEAGIDMILVGDSCANVMMGLDNTNQITIDAIVHHTRAVANGVDNAYLVGDMPFGSYLTPNDAVRNASRIIGEGGANAVKLEGFIPEAVESISKFVPVVGHLGLLPQTADCFGTRGRTFKDILRLKDESLRLQDAGCSLLVLEKVCAETTKYITELLDIPTIGIASGVHSDGQVLVWHDLLGLDLSDTTDTSESESSESIEGTATQTTDKDSKKGFKFVKQYANLSPIIVDALKEYSKDVKSKQFPESKHSFYLSEKTKVKLENKILADYQKEIAALNEEENDNGSDSESDIMNGFPHIQGNLIDPNKFWKEFAEYDTRSQLAQDYTELSAKLNVKIPKFQEISNSQESTNFKIIESPKELRRYRSQLEKEDINVIFVPFLGGLHEGHLNLIKDAKHRKDELLRDYGIKSEIWTSLFLNPTQFNVAADLVNYPMNMDDDLNALKELGCVSVVFKPKHEDMYNVPDSHFRPFVDFKNLSEKCDEAKQRDGHFQGVATVVTKLFAWIRPHKAIFGQKDFMQSVLIQRLCDEFFCDTEIIVHPTVRNENGLALSSRNRKLNENEMMKAPMIYDCLCTLAGIMMDKKRIASTAAQCNSSNEELALTSLTIGDLKIFGESYCIGKGIDLEYISFHEFKTGFALSDDFDILKDFNGSEKYVISIAGSVGPSTRLIDNIVIDIDGNGGFIGDSTFDAKMKKLFETDSATVACDESDTSAVKMV